MKVLEILVEILWLALSLPCLTQAQFHQRAARSDRSFSHADGRNCAFLDKDSDWFTCDEHFTTAVEKRANNTVESLQKKSLRVARITAGLTVAGNLIAAGSLTVFTLNYFQIIKPVTEGGIHDEVCTPGYPSDELYTNKQTGEEFRVHYCVMKKAKKTKFCSYVLSSEEVHQVTEKLEDYFDQYTKDHPGKTPNELCLRIDLTPHNDEKKLQPEGAFIVVRVLITAPDRYPDICNESCPGYKDVYEDPAET